MITKINIVYFETNESIYYCGNKIHAGYLRNWHQIFTNFSWILKKMIIIKNKNNKSYEFFSFKIGNVYLPF